MQLRLDQTVTGTVAFKDGAGQPVPYPSGSRIFMSDSLKFRVEMGPGGAFVLTPMAAGTGLYFAVTSPNGVQATSPTFDVVPITSGVPITGTITFDTPTPA